jgi:hypothetical protein
VQKSTLVMARHHASVRHAHERGVKIVMGTDCGTPFNIAEQAGTLAVGKWTDGIVLQGDPLADIRVLQQAGRITCVIKAGKGASKCHSRNVHPTASHQVGTVFANGVRQKREQPGHALSPAVRRNTSQA